MLVRDVLFTVSPPGTLGAVVSRANDALMNVIGPSASVQLGSVRAHTPFQPSKSEPSSALAVSVMTFPKPKLALQALPQSSFDAVTRPLPLPAFLTWNSTLIVVAS